MKLKQNKIYKYGYDNGKYGAEAKYLLDGTTLKIHLLGSNHWRDWIDNFTFWRMKKISGRLKAQRAWYYYAFRLYKFIEHELKKDNEIQSIIILGHSMGGAVGAILQQKYIIEYDYFPPALTHCETFGSPRPFNNYIDECYVNINRGDIVPYILFWRPQVRHVHKQGKFTLNFIKAHINYEIDITK